MKQERGNTFLGLLALIGVLFFAVWYVKSPNSIFNPEEVLSPEDEANLIEAGEERVIEITDKGFVPEHIRVMQYDTITFLNKDAALHQPMSEGEGEGQCAEFGAPRPLIQNESYSYVFSEVGSCSFFDALEPDFPSGSIEIGELE